MRGWAGVMQEVGAAASGRGARRQRLEVMANEPDHIRQP